MEIEIQGSSGRKLRARGHVSAIRAVGSAENLTLGLTPLVVELFAGHHAILGPKGRPLRIPGRWRVKTKRDEQGVSLGPVIGIFTASSRRHPKRRFRLNAGQFRRLVRQAKQMGALAFVFTPEGINWETRTIHGYTITGKGGAWVPGLFPFPHVVYNRVPNRSQERRAGVNAARRRLIDDPDVHFFNPKFLDKWEVHSILRDEEDVRRYLPDTTMYEDVDSLLAFMQKHGHVYMKRAGGSLGKGTARIDLMADNRIRWRSTLRKGRIKSLTIRDREAFARQLNRFHGGKRYLMQQAVQLLRYHGRPFDIRALVQNDPVKGWTVTGMAARIAGPRQITTHRPRGGSRARLRPLLGRVFGDPAQVARVVDQLEKAIVTAAATFDAKTGDTHGELSMDVALDRNGFPWILELNAKPMVFDEPAIRRVARKRLIQYCFGAGGFEPGSGRAPLAVRD